MSANKDHCLHLLLQSYAAWFSAAAAVPSVLQSASVGPSSEKRRGEREVLWTRRTHNSRHAVRTGKHRAASCRTWGQISISDIL